MLVANRNGGGGREGHYIAKVANITTFLTVSICHILGCERGGVCVVVAGILERCAGCTAASGWLLNRPGSCGRAFVPTALHAY